jgi:hypothetical protein
MRALACTLVDGEPAPACSVRVHPPTRPGRSSDSRNPHLLAFRGSRFYRGKAGWGRPLVFHNRCANLTAFNGRLAREPATGIDEEDGESKAIGWWLSTHTPPPLPCTHRWMPSMSATTYGVCHDFRFFPCSWQNETATTKTHDRHNKIAICRDFEGRLTAK